MKSSPFVYWTCIVLTGVITGAFVAHLENGKAFTGSSNGNNLVDTQKPRTNAIECSKDMGKAALLTLNPDSIPGRNVLPGSPHN